MTKIDRLLLLFSGVFTGFGVAILLVKDNRIEARMYFFWFALGAANLCSMIRMFTPEYKPKEKEQLFDFENESK